MDTPQSDASARFNGASLLYRLLDAGIVICGLAATELKFAEDMTGDPPIHLFLIYLCGLGVIAVFPRFASTSPRGRRLADLRGGALPSPGDRVRAGHPDQFPDAPGGGAVAHVGRRLVRAGLPSRWSARASAPTPSWVRRAIAA